MSDDAVGSMKKYIEPEFIVMALIDNSGQDEETESGEINKKEYVIMDNSNNFKEYELEWRIMQVMKDIFVEYIEYKNCGVVFRMVRNRKYRGERYN